MNTRQHKFLDVIVTSAGRDTIFRTIESFLGRVKFSGEFRFIINIDPCVTTHLNEVIAFCKTLNIKCLNINDRPAGFTQSLAFVISRVETPYYFHLEDDWVFLKDIDVDPLLELLDQEERINHICFSKQRVLDYNELFYLRKLKFVPIDCQFFKMKNMTFGQTPLVKTITYSTNPNLSRTRHFQKLWHVDFLNIEQQFSLQNFLLGDRRGYFVHGRIGDEAAVEHIGHVSSILCSKKI